MNHSSQTPPRPLKPKIVDKIGYRFQRFTHIEGISGILLVAATLIALMWANSPWADSYFRILNLHLSAAIGDKLVINEPLGLWINDGLMAIFFFVVGLELKREVAIGELSSFRKAILPALAAVGGMIVPMLIFMGLNRGTSAIDGWAIPMATDIAFALGVLALVGKRAPATLAVFLTALAIVDDIGAILIIAIFYTEQINLTLLIFALGLTALLLLYAKLGGRWMLIYATVGVITWTAFFFSGIHATIAGVLVAMTIPVKTQIDCRDFSDWMDKLLSWFRQEGAVNGERVPAAAQRAALAEMNLAISHANSPLHRLEHALHPWVAFVIMPIFALANAGIIINNALLNNIAIPLSLGIILGLVVGKPLGILIFTWLGAKFKLGSLPRGATWRHILGAGVLAGMGFTMSIFIAILAFASGGGHAQIMGFKVASPALYAGLTADEMQNLAKLAILIASTTAGILGYLILRTAPESAIAVNKVTPPDHR